MREGGTGASLGPDPLSEVDGTRRFVQDALIVYRTFLPFGSMRFALSALNHRPFRSISGYLGVILYSDICMLVCPSQCYFKAVLFVTELVS